VSDTNKEKPTYSETSSLSGTLSITVTTWESFGLEPGYSQ
jgi:hypothetical protein